MLTAHRRPPRGPSRLGRAIPARVLGVGGLTIALMLPLLPASATTSSHTLTSPTAGIAHRTGKTTTVLLPTGQRVWVTGTGTSANVAIHRAAGDGGQPMLTQRRAGQTYVVPASALPYLGHGLDRELFNVTHPATKGKAGRVMLKVTYPKARPTVTGLTVTSTSKGSARGYVTATSAAAFGRFVRARFQADQGRSGPPALFAGGATLSPATLATPTAAKTGTAKKAAATVTVTVTAIGADGQPLTTVQASLDNAREFATETPNLTFTKGVATVKVAPGDYMIEAGDITDSADGIVRVRYLVLPDLKVSGKSVKATLDFRKATLQPRAVTPNPAQQLDYALSWLRYDTTGDIPIGTDWQTDQIGELLVAPIAKAKVGTQNVGQTWQLAAPGNPSTAPYTYDLAYMSDRLSTAAAYSFTTADLATVKASYYGDGSVRTGSFLRYPGALVHGDPGSGTFQPVASGLRRTDYVGYRGPRTEGLPQWFETYLASDGVEDATSMGNLLDLTVYRAGRTTTATWGRGPLVAGIPHLSGENGGMCFACRGKNYLNVFLAPFLDSSDHVGNVTTPFDPIPDGRFQLYLGSKKLDDVDGLAQLGEGDEANLAGDVVKVGSQKGTFKAILDVDRRLQNPRLATQTRTVLKFSSAPGAGPRPPLDWYCLSSAYNCRVLPVLTARVNLATDLNGSVPAGKSTVTVSAGRIQHAGSSPLKSVKLRVRFTGKNWTTVKLTATGTGSYTGTLDSTGFAGQSADLLLQASDKGGSSFEQTTLRAYSVAGQ
jgi:hypothetical protein